MAEGYVNHFKCCAEKKTPTSRQTFQQLYFYVRNTVSLKMDTFLAMNTCKWNESLFNDSTILA